MEVHPHTHHEKKKTWKSYFWEFLMLFLAVFCGFLAENFRESLVNKEKAHHYIQNMIADLKADTTDLNFSIHYQQLWSNHLDSALLVPVDRLNNINTQDTFYYHFLPYYSWVQPFIQNDNTITQLKSGGFNFIRNENVVDSINLVYNYFRGVQFATDYNNICYWDIVRKAQEFMDMPAPSKTIEENIPKHILQNKKIFFKYDIQAIHQLYSMIENAKGSLEVTIYEEKLYLEKAERLLSFLQKKYNHN
ncbi:MAG: hypothetical protein JST17_01385 [Bacteroidetes bacterium]|nr:hypothetical protein [Bacteroidota bacterium]MBS1931936.1 hypothetical protein [Bacteroidota bacterium]